MWERLRSAIMATTATILTRVLRTDITDLAGLPVESSSALGRGITGAAADGAVVSTDAAAMAGDGAATVMDAATQDAGSRAEGTLDVVSQGAVRPAASMAAAQFAAEAASMVAAQFTAEADSTVVAADTAAADTAKSIVN